MGKAWQSWVKKPLYERYIIYRYEEEGTLRYERIHNEQVQQVGRAFAEHEVCSGAARYRDGRA